MKYPTLDEQLKDRPQIDWSVLRDIYESLDIEERGGGPEGLYYTHEAIDGEFLLRNLSILVSKVITEYKVQALNEAVVKRISK